MPQKIDLSKLSLVELKELQKHIDKAMGNAERTARKKALEDVQNAARRHGFALEELIDGRLRRAKLKSNSSPKYSNPNKGSETWSGRGRQPKWFKAAIASGVPREKMEI